MCRFLAQGLESVINKPITTSESCKSLELTPDKHGVIYIQDRSHPTMPHLHLLPLERSSASLSGRLIGAQCDMALRRKWLECCEAWHGPDCYTPGWLTGRRFPETAPFRLIDVQQQCLVRSRIESRYIALSYVWGKIDGLLALRGNLSLLEQPFGFAKLQHMIPRTVCDAITLVRLLGERYVWIDSLCIVQDDPEEKHSLIANMDAVYGNAVLTVNAADGRDADAGLSGLPTTPRQTAQAVFEYCAKSASDYRAATSDRPHRSLPLEYQGSDSEGGAPKPEIERFWSADEWTHVESSGDAWCSFVNVVLVARHGGVRPSRGHRENRPDENGAG